MPIMIDLPADVKKLMELEARFKALILKSTLTDDNDYSAKFDDALLISREAFDAKSQILLFFHPYFVNVVLVNDKLIMKVIENIKHCRDTFDSVIWYLRLVNIIKEDSDPDIEAHQTTKIDAYLQKADKKRLYFQLLDAMNQSQKGDTDTVSHDEFLRFASEMWRNEYFSMNDDDDIIQYWTRLIEIGPLLVDKSVPHNVLDYYHEIRMSYANRLPLSCVALCRALLEAGLYNMLEKKNIIKVAEIREDKRRLSDLIHYCKVYKVIDKYYIDLAYDVNNEGNIVMHSKEKVEDNDNTLWRRIDREVINIIKKTTIIAEHIYRN